MLYTSLSPYQILTFEDVSALQLLDCRSLAQSPAEKHQNHILDHFQSLKSPQQSPISCVGIPALRACYRRFPRAISRLNISKDHH